MIEFGIPLVTREPALVHAMDRQSVLRKLNEATKEHRASKRISLSRLILSLEVNSLTRKAKNMGVSDEIISRTITPDTHQNNRMRAVTGFYADQAASRATA